MNRIEMFLAKFSDHTNPAFFGVYEKSIHIEKGCIIFMAKDEKGEDKLYTYGTYHPFNGLRKENEGIGYVECPLSPENAEMLRRMYDFCRPRTVLEEECSFGVGDRLGLATPGHIKVFQRYRAVPVFAQQSMREMQLTGRTFRQVLDTVTFYVFREGYREGYGADGDHLKHIADIKQALACGFTMITLDLSDHIRSEESWAQQKNKGLDDTLKSYYLGRTFSLSGGLSIEIEEAELEKAQYIYGQALDYAARVYEECFRGQETKAQLEISIDETKAATTPAQHFFVASELLRRKTDFQSLAPRFTGEFQKGIDYIGDAGRFDRELEIHCAIAETLGYKISVHSGSDKFSVFPSIAKRTGGRFHLKTSGTNWLEAMRLVADKQPALYRNIHKYAVSVFEQARAYYHVSADVNALPDLDKLEDASLPLLFEDNDARQVIHITYGFILSHPVYAVKLREFWKKEQHAYEELVEMHIAKHFELLQIPCRRALEIERDTACAYKKEHEIA